ncbi:MAG: mandelate racemase/muconate lactonizing enzyme family protein [Bacteroidota bacterium]
MKRRDFLTTTSLGVGAITLSSSKLKASAQARRDQYTAIDAAYKQAVLKRELFTEPVIIDTLELLHYQGNFICRVCSKDGAVGLSIANNRSMKDLYPIFTNRLQPFFIGKDARELEQLLEEVYVYKSNYKLQNLTLWVPLATIEFAILDMLGHIADRPIGELIGDIHHPEIAVYQANNYRGQSAKVSLEKIKATVAKSQAQAVKFKIGGRMSRPEEPKGRTERLIPMVREAFGADMTIYADSNGSYNVAESVRIGKILEANKIDFYEEPTPFDWYEETKTVNDLLTIPIAGGEQEPSMHNFRWLIGNDALDIVQPDIFYFGGMIRAMKVARMAAAVEKTCVPHISGSGLGYLYMMHFVSALPNAGLYHEFKGFNTAIPIECATSDLQSKNGNIKVPTGAGAGIIIDPDYVRRHEAVVGLK